MRIYLNGELKPEMKERAMRYIYESGDLGLAARNIASGLPVPEKVAIEAAESDDPSRRIIAAMGTAIPTEVRERLQNDEDRWVRYWAEYRLGF